MTPHPTFNNTVEITPILHKLRVVSLNPIFSRMLWLESESVIDREFHWIPSANEKQGNFGQRSRQFDSWSFHGHLTAWHGRRNLHVWTELGNYLVTKCQNRASLHWIPFRIWNLLSFRCWLWGAETRVELETDAIVENRVDVGFTPPGCQSPQGCHYLFSRQSLQTFICHCCRVGGRSNLYVCFVSMSFRVAVTIFNVNDWPSYDLGLYIVMSVQYSGPESTSPEVDQVKVCVCVSIN